jgi:4-hydroxy-tetrahydrodipicolinate synthase
MNGIITVLNTPFAQTGEVDTGAVAAHCRYGLSAGVAGFLVPAMAAEVGNLRASERDAMVSTVVAASAGQVPVIGGASAASHAERLETSRRVAELGCDVVLASIPYRTNEQFIGEVRDIVSVSDRPLMVQDWDATGDGIPIDAILNAFGAVDNFRFLKVETANAGRKYTALIEATGGALHVSGGWAVQQLIEGLDRGVDAFMPTAMHFTYTEIVRRHRSGNRDDAADLFHRLLPVLAFSNQDLDLSIRFFKRLLWRQGLYPTPDVRVGGAGPDAYQLRIMDELIELAIALETALGWEG